MTVNYYFYPPGLPQVFTAVNGKLILAKYVHSVNVKEEEEHVFFLFLFFVGNLRRRKGRGGSEAKIARQLQ